MGKHNVYFSVYNFSRRRQAAKFNKEVERELSIIFIPKLKQFQGKNLVALAPWRELVLSLRVQSVFIKFLVSSW